MDTWQRLPQRPLAASAALYTTRDCAQNIAPELSDNDDLGLEYGASAVTVAEDGYKDGEWTVTTPAAVASHLIHLTPDAILVVFTRLERNFSRATLSTSEPDEILLQDRNSDGLVRLEKEIERRIMAGSKKRSLCTHTSRMNQAGLQRAA